MRAVSVVIVAGGMGKRLEMEIPKAFIPIGDKELFLYCAEVFDAMNFAEIIIVVPEIAVERTKKLTQNFKTEIIVTQGGKERHNSVENGVKKASGEIVIIHDAARPFISVNLVAELLQNYENNDFCGVISANPVVDTIRRFEGNLCAQTINRDELIAVGTPQIFDKKALLECFEKIGELDKIPTDEAMLAQNFGHKVGWVKGSRTNFKITTPQDLVLARAIVKNGGIV
jgi:2-C-methyl-D-erythritol 4-phosphate cytidylyltransferase